MKRTARDNRDMPHPKPVEKIELSEKHTKLRFVIVVLLVLIAVIAFAYGAVKGLGKEDGWNTIEVDSGAGLNSGSEFVFQYRLGESGISPAAENKAVSMLYTEAMVKAYRIFNNDAGSEDFHNIYSINRHPNEELEIDEVLYQAFALCREYGIRNHYLAPAYEQYDSLFYCNDDWETVSFDPLQNKEQEAFFAEVAGFAGNSSQVEVQLLGENRIKLFVSEAYLAYAEAEGISSFVDFYWMKNGFIADYVADLMIENGYTKGSISSYDGFVRTLEEGGTEYAFNLYDRDGQIVYPAAVMKYSGRRSIVYLRDYQMNSLDFQHYYEMADGQVRTPYLDIRDGLPRTAVHNLVCYSEDVGCAELLMQMIPVYIADSFEAGSLPEYSIYGSRRRICYNDSMLRLTDVYDGYATEKQ